MGRGNGGGRSPRISTVLAGVAVASALALAGCSSSAPEAGDGPEKTKETPPPSSAPPSPSKTPTKPSDTQLEADLVKTVNGYYGALDEAYQKMDPSGLRKWSFTKSCTPCGELVGVIGDGKAKGWNYEKSGPYKATETKLLGGGEIPRLSFVLTTPPSKVTDGEGKVVKTSKTRHFRYVALFGKGRDNRWYIKQMQYTEFTK